MSRDAMEDLLQCMICFESYRNPKMLRCAHTFCADCLVGYQKTYDQQRRAVPGTSASDAKLIDIFVVLRTMNKILKNFCLHFMNFAFRTNYLSSLKN